MGLREAARDMYAHRDELFGGLWWWNSLSTLNKEMNMIIIFNGTTEDLLKRLEQYSGKDQKLTLDFMLANFKILEGDDPVGVIWEHHNASNKK